MSGVERIVNEILKDPNLNDNPGRATTFHLLQWHKSAS